MNRIVSNWRHESCMMDQSSLVLSQHSAWVSFRRRSVLLDGSLWIGGLIARQWLVARLFVSSHIEFFLLKNVAALYILGCCKRRRE
jgi:hypothetical protein